jgi:CMP/dCMP kinase
MKDELVITIDGPVGAGKSAVARTLARRLGVRYLDTGAMYRAVTLKALRNQADLADPVALTRLAESSEIELRPGADGPGVFLDGEDVSREIRSLEVTNNAYAPSGTPGVRRRMVELQRRAAEQGPLVAEGRDMGTVVFPDSPAKFYLDASPDERARRRHAEHRAKGEAITIEELKQQILQRDRRDSERAASPLRPADDAVHIDSTALDIDGVVEAMLSVLKGKGLLGDA